MPARPISIAAKVRAIPCIVASYALRNNLRIFRMVNGLNVGICSIRDLQFFEIPRFGFWFLSSGVALNKKQNFIHLVCICVLFYKQADFERFSQYLPWLGTYIPILLTSCMYLLRQVPTQVLGGRRRYHIVLQNAIRMSAFLAAISHTRNGCIFCINSLVC